MRLVSTVVSVLLFCLTLSAQSDRGTITGEVHDQTGAVVPNATVAVSNAATGTQFRATTTGTGNYTIPSLPSGTYTINVDVAGFKKFVQENIQVEVSLTNRVDIALEVGAASETVTISAEAAQLKTENAEQSTVIRTETVNSLPLNFGGGAGSSGTIRDPFAFNVLSPGVVASPIGTGTSGATAAVNGQPSLRIELEGRDMTSQNDPAGVTKQSRRSVDSVVEFSLQTSNFAAEFSQVGGGFYNFTTKSGTNS